VSGLPLDFDDYAAYRCAEHVPTHQELVSDERERIEEDFGGLCDSLIDDAAGSETYADLGQIVRYLLDGEAIEGMDWLHNYIHERAVECVRRKT